MVTITDVEDYIEQDIEYRALGLLTELLNETYSLEQFIKDVASFKEHRHKWEN
jgi:hypothetical protein